MPYKLLSNLIAPGSVQHMAGEIVDNPTDQHGQPIGESLVKRGIAEVVETAATHVYGQLATGASRGGKPVNEPEQPVTPPTPPAPEKTEEDEEDLAADQQIEKATAVGNPPTTPPAPTAGEIAKDPQLK